MAVTCTLGVDIGTSSSKGVLVDPAGRTLASAVREHRVQRPRPGWVEMDGDVWWREFRGLVRELCRDRDVQVEAVGVSGMGPCVLLTDDEDRPVRPAILYGVDTRAGDQITRLDAELGAQQVIARCGSALTSQAAGPKIAWVAEQESQAYARARRLFMPASWLVRRLTDGYVLDVHSASQCTPLFDLEALSWHRPWAEAVAPGIELPQLAWAGDVAGTVSAGAAAETGLAQGVPVITGTIDAWTEAVSVGAQRAGDLMLMYGTTMFLVATVQRTLRTPSMWSTAGTSPGTYSLAGGMATSGAITGWLRDLTGGSSYGDLVAEAAASPPGARGLLLLPYFAGERTPIMDPQARGVIAGLTLSHGRGDLYRAALEGTAYGVRHNVETLRSAGADVQRVVAAGGGTQGTLWTQIVSDVTGLPQQVPATTVGASYGAAFLAASAVAAPGAAPAIEDWNPVARVVEPDPATAERYEAGYASYRELYQGTREVVHRLAAVQHSA